jgi:para-aminobenzoate synthetase/4-amino-4-deoxychorismate lyase
MAVVPAPVPQPAVQARPDPALGVFETLLVVDDHPVERDAHLARLRASLTALYPHLTPPPLDVPVVDPPHRWSTTGTSVEALRIAVAPDSRSELVATVERRPAAGHFATENGGQSTTRPVALQGFTLAGGLGAHKWADRSLLDRAQAKLPDGALPLILDGDGSVLEASRANVFAVRDGALFTPPLDGRILPGVTRMRVIELAGTLGLEAHQEPLSRDDLLTADEVFLTGSVRGIEVAASLDGAPLAGAGEAAERLAAELRRAWVGVKTTAAFG